MCGVEFDVTFFLSVSNSLPLSKYEIKIAAVVQDLFLGTGVERYRILQSMDGKRLSIGKNV